MCSFKQDVSVTLFYSVVLHPSLVSRNVLLDAIGFRLFTDWFLWPSSYSSSLVPGGSRRFPLETAPCDILSVPFSLLSLPSAPSSVSSSFVTAVKGGRGHWCLQYTGPSAQIVALHFLELLCSAERMWAIFMVLRITIAARGPKQTQGPLCFPSCKQKSYTMKHQNAQDKHWVGECPFTGSFPLKQSHFETGILSVELE